jgi:hypothetical protein
VLSPLEVAAAVGAFAEVFNLLRTSSRFDRTRQFRFADFEI